jgi:hypothetical protein
MPMVTGTAYFVSFKSAVRYYRGYGFAEPDVKRKLDLGEFHIGKPEIKDGERLVLLDDGARYGIQY